MLRNRIIITICFIILLAPIYWMFNGSLQDLYGVFIMPPRLIPVNATLNNYRGLFASPYVGAWFVNTVVVVLSRCFLSVLTATTAGYAFAFHQFRGKKALWIFLLAGIMIPHVTMIVPLFVVINKMGLSGTHLGVILPKCFSPVGMYLARTYFQSIPPAVLESARIDGASELQIFRRIVLPIARPIVTALALFAAIGALGDFIWQMLMLQHASMQTLLIGIMRQIVFLGGDDHLNPIGRSLAGGVVLIVPVLLIFIIANRYFTSALGGAVKE